MSFVNLSHPAHMPVCQNHAPTSSTITWSPTRIAAQCVPTKVHVARVLSVSNQDLETSREWKEAPRRRRGGKRGRGRTGCLPVRSSTTSLQRSGGTTRCARSRPRNFEFCIVFFSQTHGVAGRMAAREVDKQGRNEHCLDTPHFHEFMATLRGIEAAG